MDSMDAWKAMNCALARDTCSEIDCTPERALDSAACVLSLPLSSIVRDSGVLGIHIVLLPLLALAATFVGFIVSPWFFLLAILFFLLWAAGFIRYVLTGR